MPNRLLSTLFFALLLAGCEPGQEESFTVEMNQRELPTTLAGWIEESAPASFERLKGVPLSSVDCSSITSDAAGTYTCAATAGDVAFDLKVGATPIAPGDVSAGYELRVTPLRVSTKAGLEGDLSERLRESTGENVPVECGAPEVWLSSVGERVRCTAVLPNAETLFVEFEITNERGGFTLHEYTP